MYGSQFDGGASLFSGGGFMPSQATQTPDSTFSKSRSAQGALPLTVKQISEAYHSNDDKSNFLVDGVDASNVRLRGLVMNKVEKVTDVTFTLDDGTGRIEVHRWVNETSDTNEMALVQNGMYVTINGSLKGFQGNKHVVAFSVRPVIDFNEITLHFIECIHVHMENTRPKVLGGVPAQVQANPVSGTVTPTRTPVSNQFSARSSSSVSETDVYKLVLDVFQEPANLADTSCFGDLTACSVPVNMDYMWMKLPDDWAYQWKRSRMLLITMLMLAIFILQLMTTTTSLHAMANVHLIHVCVL